MVSGNTVAEIASLLGDAARANMLSALMGGVAMTAGELAQVAGVTAQTASGHLAKMVESGLLAREKQGRHRYYRLASGEVAQLLDALMLVAANAPARHRPLGPRDDALRRARSCYDHMAGRLAVALSDAVQARGFLILEEGVGLLTEEGERFFAAFGLTLRPPRSGTRPLCRACLDWSERRMHLAGQLGAALFDQCLARGWVARIPDSRSLRISRAGELGFARHFGLAEDWDRPARPGEWRGMQPASPA
ncbi:ArsR/SmtB family transcription factor [Xaviernesmea oryzae]|nr:metalloregulator ArsR/SmtB family transcription factor [Xaviernesmea oryzae]SEL77559.1 DNA-binding transcriptional regulator, ArsR family [Xaviernesmea oryzae]